MAHVFEGIEPKLAEFIEKQNVFFVATAPLAAEGHVNLSPKGLDSFRILDPHTVAYLDMTGSGIETVAHLRENGRIVIMFCSFEGGPKILRLHGKGVPYEAGEPGFDELVHLFPKMLGTRSIIKINVERVADSCGYAVPLMNFKEHRRTLNDYAENMGAERIAQAQQKHNRVSIDGIPGLKVAPMEPAKSVG